MKKALIKYIRRYSYPQTVFVSSIKPYIDNGNINELVDVPCGYGATTWRFSLLRNLKVYGYDISFESISVAQKSFNNSNLKFGIADIKNVIAKHSGVKYVSIINSLFLLPETDQLLEDIRTALQADGKLFIVVPNVNNVNFKLFEEANFGTNKLRLDDTEFLDFFQARKWFLESIVPIVYARSFNRKDVAFLSVFSPFYLWLLNHIQTLLKIGTPNYFLLILHKQD